MNATPRPPLVALLALALLAPFALAHDPPGPVLACEAATQRHDYVAGVERLAYERATPPLTADGSLDACDPADPASGAGYDGDLDHGVAGARLFVLTGDGATGGVLACYGAPSTGHHSATVLAWDVGGFGPQFVVHADASRTPPSSGPDCGDALLEPCDPHPPPPKNNPFPMSIPKDILNNQLYELSREGGPLCTAGDRFELFDSNPSAPSGGLVPFPPGADGTYLVQIQEDYNTPLLATAGHVWTTGTYMG